MISPRSAIMATHRLVFIGFALLLPLLQAEAKETAPVLMMPPSYDYTLLCKAEATRLDPQEIKRLRQQGMQKLTPAQLLRLAEAYSGNGDAIAQDYPYALQVIERILKEPYIGENRPIIDNALFIKQDLLEKGKLGAVKWQEAKEILDQLMTRNHAKAYRRYAEMLEEEQHYTEAADYYKKAIIGGNITAYFKLANLYRHHKIPGPPASFNRALTNANTAALQQLAQGNCGVMVELAKFYASLDTIPQAREYSRAWLEEAAATESIPAKLLYAKLRREEAQISKDWRPVVSLWEEAAHLGSVKAMRSLGSYYLSDSAKNPEKASLWLEKASQRADVKASTLMLWAKSLHELDPPPYGRMIEIYENAAAKGREDAWYELARIYQYDLHEPSHLQKALTYYEKAAKAGHISSMRALNTAYRCQIGVHPDKEKADYWASQIMAHSEDAFLERFYNALRSEEEAIPPAMLKRLTSFSRKPENIRSKVALLAYRYVHGEKEDAEKALAELVEKDASASLAAHAAVGEVYIKNGLFSNKRDDGLRLLHRAAQEQNTSALLLLGDTLSERKQYREAVQYYRLAAPKANAAYRKLYHIYEDQENLPLAMAALEHLARQGDILAMLWLAQHFSDEIPDAQKARFWFARAVDHFPCDAEEIQFIADAYRFGENGAPKDVQSAEKWSGYLYRLPMTGDQNTIALARIFLYQEEADEKTRQKQKEALQLLTQMAENGDNEARNTLIDYYLMQERTAPVISLLTAQAKEGSITSMITLSNLYFAGFADLAADPSKGFDWLKRAKEAGSKTASRRLAMLQ